MQQVSDADLVALVRAGSVEAAGELFDRYWVVAWRAAYVLTTDAVLADDAAQDAILQGFAALERFDETRPFGPWLKRIAINKAIDHLRRRRRDVALDETPSALHQWTIGDAADGDLRLWAVADAVAALASEKRTVVVLRYWLDLPLEEIAEVLGVPFGTVASRLSRALNDLRLALDGEYVV